MLPTQVGLRLNGHGQEVQLEVNPAEPWPAGQEEEDGDARRDGMFCTEDGTPHGQTMALIIAVVFVTPISWVLFSWSKEESDGSQGVPEVDCHGKCSGQQVRTESDCWYVTILKAIKNNDLSHHAGQRYDIVPGNGRQSLEGPRNDANKYPFCGLRSVDFMPGILCSPHETTKANASASGQVERK